MSICLDLSVVCVHVWSQVSLSLDLSAFVFVSAVKQVGKSFVQRDLLIVLELSVKGDRLED